MIAWLAVQYTAHLCAAGSIRAMPETETPPRFYGGIFIVYDVQKPILKIVQKRE